MPIAFRLLHIAAAALFGGLISSVIAGFGRLVDPSEYAAMRPTHWFMLIMFFGAPLWVPAAIPSRFPRLLHAARLGGAALLLFPTFMAATVIPHNFLFGAAVTLSCAAFLSTRTSPLLSNIILPW
ncbi:hypothetical protein [Acidovorax sp.]|uniref:hypothetical protein n=1 Tax=Acidovorax sp. TaxID=1872122 RepID=UPI00391EE8B2